MKPTTIYLMKYPLGVILVFSCMLAKSQEVDYTPVQYGQFFNMYPIINPASTGFREKLELLSGRQQLGGPWKHISTTFVNGFTRFNDRKNGKFQAAGLMFVADNEGKYLSRSRACFNYSWHTPLTKNASLAAGASVGFFSYRVGGSDASVSGSAMAPDAAIGLWFYTNKYYLGVSGNQVLNNEVTPILETTRLIRHINLTGGYTWELSKSLSMTPRFLLRYARNFTSDIDVAVTGTINKVFSVGANYRHQKSVVPVVGFENIKVKEGVAKLMFSYGIPVGKIADNIQTYELMLGYQVKPPKKKNKGKKKVTTFTR